MWKYGLARRGPQPDRNAARLGRVSADRPQTRPQTRPPESRCRVRRLRRRAPHAATSSSSSQSSSSWRHEGESPPPNFVKIRFQSPFPPANMIGRSIEQRRSQGVARLPASARRRRAPIAPRRRAGGLLLSCRPFAASRRRASFRLRAKYPAGGRGAIRSMQRFRWVFRRSIVGVWSELSVAV